MNSKRILLMIVFVTVFAVLPNYKINESFAQTTETVQTANPTEDIFTAGQSVDIKGEKATGDVAVAGANVNVSGEVSGYVMAAGANVNINAPIGNDLWAAGANVIVNNPVADNAMIAGSTVVIEQNGSIGHDARIASSSASIKGRITRELQIVAADARISSEIGGNVTAKVQQLTLEPGAIVRGDLNVFSPNEPQISPQAQVLGKINYQRTENAQSNSKSFGNWLGNWILTFLWIAILGLLSVRFSHVWVNRVAEMLKTQTAKSFLVGLVVMIVVPVVFIILLVTVIGLPLAFLLGAFAFVIFILSGAFVSYFVGEWFTKQIKSWENSNVAKIVCGALIITFLMSLPWLGGLVKLAVMFFGAGAFLLERRDLFGKLREQGLA